VVTKLAPARFRAALLEERERVVRAIEYLHDENQGSLEDDTGELAPGLDNHPADAATETFDRELDYSLEESAEALLGAIDAALARIEVGAYGRCENCGREISPGRLDAIPWTTLCLDCKRTEERG
jgi:RNA polymerase-binding protein DksA